MGVSNFKPSIHHKVQSGHKVFNILNNPMIALASPRIECQWANGMPPRPQKLNRKLQDEFDDRPHSELMLSLDAINNQPAKSPRKSSRKKAKKLAAAKARKIARQNGDAANTMGSGQSSQKAADKRYECVDHLVSDSSTESKHRKKQENALLTISRRQDGTDATSMSNPSPERSMA